MSALPDIQTFSTLPTDQFVVDLADVDAGHPFKGQNANDPHQGAHVQYDNTSSTWPHGGVSPSGYPAIYAVADGTIESVDTYYPVLTNYRYGIDLAFAKSGTSKLLFSYSIEPMINPGDSTFYEPFILVHKGQKVSKGDIIAYLYLPPGGGIGSHIHFHIVNLSNGQMMAPAIFSSTLVSDFHNHFGIFGNDGSDPIPACMGYKLTADENPYGSGAVTCL